MSEIRVRKDLRIGERRQTYTELPSEISDKRRNDRRVACWDIAGCDSATRQDCYAYSAGRNCWDVWALRPIDRKYCCKKLADCRQCAVVTAKFKDAIFVHLQTTQPTQQSMRRPAVCGQLVVEGRAEIAGNVVSTLTDLLKIDRDIFRCRRRGVHLEGNYVSDICASGVHVQCVFLED